MRQMGFYIINDIKTECDFYLIQKYGFFDLDRLLKSSNYSNKYDFIYNLEHFIDRNVRDEIKDTDGQFKIRALESIIKRYEAKYGKLL